MEKMFNFLASGEFASKKYNVFMFFNTVILIEAVYT